MVGPSLKILSETRNFVRKQAVERSVEARVTFAFMLVSSYGSLSETVDHVVLHCPTH